MPKQKTNRAAAKRFSLTKSGKVKYRKMFRNHILNKKNTKRMRQLRQGGYIDGADAQKIKKLIPYK